MTISHTTEPRTASSASKNTMTAVVIAAYGSPDELRLAEVPIPTPGPGEVLVRMHCAGVNPVDWKTRAGSGVAHLMPDFPLILGWDVAGTVAAVGPGVTAHRVGGDVLGLIGFPNVGAAYAEYVVAPAEQLVRKSALLSFEEAAGLPLVGLTAWQALFGVADLQPGQRVLVHAAAGGVGHLAVQLAKWRGAYVIGTSSAQSIPFLEELGCDEQVDYESGPFEDVIDRVDVIIDGLGGAIAGRSLDVLAPGGIVVSLPGGVDEKAASRRGLRATGMLVHPDEEQLGHLTRLVAAGVVRPYVDTVLPLAQAARAHEIGEAGHVHGKLVLRVAS